MTDRVLAGEEVIVRRGMQPVARFVPVAPRPSKRFGTLKEYLSEEQRLALDDAISADPSEEDRRILAGEGTDELGIWKGLPRGRKADDDA